MRKCIIVLNLSNFTGSLNHSIKNSDGSYEKLRVDYADMLKYLTGDRTLVGSYIISQQDINATNKTLEQLQANQKFIQGLKKFGWESVRVSYNSADENLSPVFDAIWQNVLSPFVNEDGSWSINPATTDIIFVNGTSSWFEIIDTFAQNGFQVEIAYPHIAVSKLLMANFAFLDLTSFLISSNSKINKQ